jgi:diguanylate cyclase (GGDEF)-like protein/PAS domain S-box-containing protein
MSHREAGGPATAGSPLLPAPSGDAELALLQRRFERERAARKAAESLLAEKSRELYTAAQAARDAERRLSLALWASGEGIWDWTANKDRIRMQGLEVAGQPVALDIDTLAALMNQVHAADRDAALLSFKLYASGARDDIDTAFRLPLAGTLRWVRVRGRALERDAAGRPVKIAGTIKDVTSQRDAEQSLQVMAHAFASAHEALVVVDAQGRIVQANEAFCGLAGQPMSALEGQPLALLVTLNEDAGFEGAWRGESVLGQPGHERHVEVTVAPVAGHAGHGNCYIVALRDVTQRREAAAALQRQALHDALTALPNRAALMQHLEDRITQARHDADPETACAEPFTLIFVDLDGFKPVNDMLGHQAGDQVLQQVAARMAAAVPEAFLARWGGDEFVLVLPGPSGEDEARTAAERLHLAMVPPLPVLGQSVSVTPSVGAVRFPHDGSDAPTLLRRADAAMYAAKDRGRNRLVVFESALDEQLQRKTRLQSQLRSDAERAAFHFVVQPKVNAAGVCTGGELLMRWTTEFFGPVSPAEFIPLAEQLGLIESLGRQALDAAAQLATQLRRLGLRQSVAVNLSPRQLLDEGIVQVVMDACARHGADPSQLELELTESALVTDIEQVAARLVLLRDHGFNIALDDFGTGYSSLSHLRALPFHKVKIDRSFVSDLDTDRRSIIVLQGIVHLCRSLGLRTVAEGVETAWQFECLRDIGIEEFQGYHFARPQSCALWLGELSRVGAEATTRRLAKPAE